MLADQASQFEHGDLFFAEYGFEFLVSVDVALVDRVLQAVLLDVNPQLADYLCTGYRCGADDSG